MSRAVICDVVTSDQDQWDQPAPRKRRPWKRWFLAFVGVLILFLWYSLWQGGVSVGPAKANISKIESSDTFAHGMTTSSSDGGRLAASRIVITAKTPHELLDRVIPLVQAELVKLPFVNEVAIVPHGTVICDGGVMPDVLITLDLAKIDESSSPLQRTMKATVKMRMSTGIAGAPNSYYDSLSPPTVGFDLNGTLEHESTSMGDGVGAERYRLTAPHIAKEINKVLAKQLQKLNEDHGPLPPLPPAFFGTFRPAPDLAAVTQTQAQPIVRGSGLFHHHQAVWEFRDPREPKAVFDEIEQALAPAGWKKSDSQVGEGMSYLRMTNGPRVFNIFTRRDGSTDLKIDSPAPSPGEKYGIHYTDRFSRAELDSALESFADTPDLELLLSFRGILTPELRKKLIARLESQPGTSASAYLFLAEHYEKSDPEKAKGHLRRAFVLTSAMEKDSSLRNRAEDLAKKLKIEKLSREKFDVELLSELQIPQLTATPLQRTVALDEPVVAYIVGDDKTVRLTSVRVTRSGDSKATPFQVIDVITSGGSKTSGRTGGSLDPSGRFIANGGTGFNGTRIGWEIKAAPGDKFDITLRRYPKT